MEGKGRATGFEKPELACYFHVFHSISAADAERTEGLEEHVVRLPLHAKLTLIHLSVCKDGGVVALEAAVDQLLRAGGVDGVLLRVHVEHVVVGKGLVFAQDHLRLSRHHIGTDVTSLYLLSGQLRTNPKKGNTDILTLQQ